MTRPKSTQQQIDALQRQIDTLTIAAYGRRWTGSETAQKISRLMVRRHKLFTQLRSI